MTSDARPTDAPGLVQADASTKAIAAGGSGTYTLTTRMAASTVDARKPQTCSLALTATADRVDESRVDAAIINKEDDVSFEIRVVRPSAPECPDHVQTTNGPQNSASYGIGVRNSAQAKVALTRT